MPTDYLDFTIGHRLLQDHPYFADSSLLDFRVYARINENWGVSAYERYELDDSTLEITGDQSATLSIQGSPPIIFSRPTRGRAARRGSAGRSGCGAGRG